MERDSGVRGPRTGEGEGQARHQGCRPAHPWGQEPPHSSLLTSEEVITLPSRTDWGKSVVPGMLSGCWLPG